MSENESATAAEGARTPAETTSEATPSIEWIRDFAQRWIDACNSHEVDRLLALMSEDIEYRDDAWPKPMRGHADVREFLEASWRAFPDITFELLDGPYVIPGEPAPPSIGAVGPPTPAGSTQRLRAHRPPLGTGRRRLSRVSRRSRVQVAHHGRRAERLAPTRPHARGGRPR